MKTPVHPRLLAATAAFGLTFAALLPNLSQPQHGDEAQYIWSSAYYGGKLAHLDFRPGASDPVTDPGWSPPSYWNLTQPMGARAVYALAMGIAQAPAPPARQHYSPFLSPPDEVVDPRTLLATRLAAIACAALGFGLVALRLGWRGLAVAAAMLALPAVRGDLARAWAEGPLLLGLGLATLSYGRTWFAPAAGLAAAFKLNALALWPLVFLTTPIGRSRFRHVFGLFAAAGTWTLLTPPAWFTRGPGYLLFMLFDRGQEYQVAAASAPGAVFGLFIPSRYLWPVALGLLITAAAAMPRVWAFLATVGHERAAANQTLSRRWRLTE